MKTAEYITYKYEKKTVLYDIEDASDYDYSIFTPKKNCRLFRVITALKIQKLIVSINIDSNLLYFLKDYNVEESNWDTKSIKLDYPIAIT